MISISKIISRGAGLAPVKARISSLIILGFLTSCSQEMTWEESFKRLQLFRDAGEKIGKECCGKPLKVQASKQANMHRPEVTDTVRTYYCPSFTIEIYESSWTPKRELVQKVKAHKPISLPFGIGVGSTRAQIEVALGKPTNASARGLRYSIETDSIFFLVSNEQVAEVIWSSDLL